MMITPGRPMGDSEKPERQLSSPYSTGGGGFVFETRVQAAYVVLMLTGGFSPCLRSWPITRIKLQGGYAGYKTDDFIAFATEIDGNGEAKLLAQIKHVAAITESDNVFKEVICAAWKDFTNPRLFNVEIDTIALITGPLSAEDTNNARTLLEWARTSANAEEFIEKVKSRISSNPKRRKLNAFRVNLGHAKGEPVTDDELWRFMQSFHLLAYDFDIENGVAVSFLRSIIGRNASVTLDGVWEKIVSHVQHANQNAGTITIETLPSDILEAFVEYPLNTIPARFAPSRPAISSASPVIMQSPNDLTMALMIGEWVDTSHADVTAIEALIGFDYSTWITRVREMLHQDDSPLSFRNGHWEVAERLELWRVLGSRVFDDHLDRFRTMAETALRERNPELDLEPEERYAASVHGKVLKHSRPLRKGIASTLAILGNHHTLFDNCSTGKAETVAFLTVHCLLEETNWESWASLDDVLPLLAEAAPVEFLDAVDHALQGSPCPFDELFAQERSGVLGRTYASGLLWALESLAWEPTYCVRVVSILGRLAAIDPDGSYSNRPSNSLATILLPWLPQTLAPPPTRKIAVEVLMRDFPDIAWKLLITLLPRSMQSSSCSHKPKWRKIIPDDRKDGVTRVEYWEQVETYSELALKMAFLDVTKLPTLLERIDNLPQEQRKKLLCYISSGTVTSLHEDVRTNLWNVLQRVIAKHRRFTTAQWALHTSEVDEIEKASEAIAPKSPMYRFHRLFSERDFELLDGKGDFTDQQARLDDRRREAIRLVFQKSGLVGVIELANQSDSPKMVGAALGTIEDDSTEREIVPRLLLSDEEALHDLSVGYVHGRFQQLGWSWVDGLDLASWMPEQRGQFFAHLPFTSEAWKRVSKLLADDEAPYWRKTPGNPYQEASDLTPAIERLIEFDRAITAIDCIEGMLHKNQVVDSQVLIAALDAISDSSPFRSSFFLYAIGHLITTLQERQDLPTEEVARIEWKFLSVLDNGHETRPLTLERGLAEDASFFCETIRTIYRSKNEDAVSREPSEEETERASSSFTLLFHWKYPPGLQEDGSFDGNHFAAWLSQVKEECTTSGHLGIAFDHVGRVLRYCPEDPDGLWLPRSVAEALNAPDTRPMREGFRTEYFNSRGVHRFSAGKEERNLAEKYEQYAQAVEEYPSLATEMRRLAAEYKREGQQQTDHDLD